MEIMTMTPTDFAKDVQRRLKDASLYEGMVDGKPGPMTMAALDRWTAMARDGVEPVKVGAKAETAGRKPGAEKLKGVHPDMVSIIEAAAYTRDTAGQPGFRVIEGIRTKERQQQLVKAKLSKTMKSRHLTGHAVDLWPLDKDGKPLPSPQQFKPGSREARDADKALWAGLRDVAASVKAEAAQRGIAIEWGGDWKSFPDGPHFQLTWAKYPE